MITLVLGELYGMDSQKELMQTIEELRRMGMSDGDIQVILDRSKTESESDFPQAKDIEPTVKGFVDTMNRWGDLVEKGGE